MNPKSILLLVLAACLAAVMGTATFVAVLLFYNPDVDLGPPRVVHRPGHPGPITVVMGGDTAPTDAAMPLLEQHGYRYPYLATQSLLRDADIAFLNLEAPVTLSDEPTLLPKKYIYKIHPQALEAWQWLGVDVMSLANNHMADYRMDGVLDTVQYLDAAGIGRVGGGTTEADARTPMIFDVGGTRIGFLAYQENRLDLSVWYRSFAVGPSPGCARFIREHVEKDVRRLRPLVDILVVSVHWGDNYKDVSYQQEDAGRWLADLGVDVVAGHHAHDVQSFETRGRSLILYSLGNYAFGTIGRDTLRVGFLARLSIQPRTPEESARITDVELLPLLTQNRMVNYQPRPLRPEESGFLDKVLAASAARGTRTTFDGTVVRVEMPER